MTELMTLLALKELACRAWRWDMTAAPGGDKEKLDSLDPLSYSVIFPIINISQFIGCLWSISRVLKLLFL